LDTVVDIMCVDVLQFFDVLVQRRHSDRTCAKYIDRRHCSDQAVW